MALACPECGFELKPYFLQSPDYHSCHVCGFETSVLPYPACFAVQRVITPEDLRRDEEDASCFYHESKKAVQSCGQCGRFVCALCSVQIGNDILCPGCIMSGEKRAAAGTAPGTDKLADRLERTRTLYDSLALIVSLAPILTVWGSLIGGPASIYLALRYWKRPTSIVRRYQWRKWLALGLGLAQTVGWIWLIAYISLQRRVG
jgi:hypothetical protein